MINQANTTKETSRDNGSPHDRLTEALVCLTPKPNAAIAPVVPEEAPFSQGQRQWLNGLLTGLTFLARAAQDNSGQRKAEAPAAPLTILYGSQSGNCEALSKDLRKRGKAAGYKPEIKELNEVSHADLAAMAGSGTGRVLILCSTFGEGDPPDNAMKFCEAIHADDAPRLEGLSFSICGLGDSSYTHFNKTGRELDIRLAELGAARAVDFVACDVDYEEDYERWKSEVFTSESFRVEGAANPSPVDKAEDKPQDRYTKAYPFNATVLEVRNLSGSGSRKEVNHVEISLAGSGITYDVGDTLGVWPTNCPGLVNDILDVVGFTGKEIVTLKSGPSSLRAGLIDHLDLCTISPKTIEALSIEAPTDKLVGLQIIDLLENHRPDITPQQLVDALRPLQPRLYSIASSHNAHPGEAHLTVGAVRYQTHGRERKGVASTYLADLCACGSHLGVYLQRSAHFHLPPDDVPLIMIGPGTGIAPFRAFLQERASRKAMGRNWLFFGDQHEASDCLYRQEINRWLEDGTLKRFDAAWSRDQDEKIYVQHLMLQQGRELWDWLKDGAAVYVCGDASRMAKDVDTTLHRIISDHGGLDETATRDYVERLKSNHRYQRDVY